MKFNSQAPFKVRKGLVEPDIELSGDQVVCAFVDFVKAPYFNRTTSYFVLHDSDPDQMVWRLSYSGNKPYYEEHEEEALDCISTIGLPGAL